jgi:transposase
MHFNPVLRVIADENLTPTLYDLVTTSAAPLAAVEETFAVDSTGFGTLRYYRHFAAKWGSHVGKEIEKRDWIKLHAIIGCKTNVICAADVSARNAGDAPRFVPLLNKAADTFAIKTVVADKDYASRPNVRRVAEIGTDPVIALRSDMVAWAKYHARSNAESTFSSLKRVFGDMVRAKGDAAQENELLLKVIAYNIVCVVHSIFELGVEFPGLPLNGATCTKIPA